MKVKMNSFKWFIIAALVVVVAGMAMLGFMGLNNTVEHKEGGYEVYVEIDQPVDGAKDVLKESAETFFKDNGVKFLSCNSMGEGYVYTFRKDVEDKIVGLDSAIKSALNNATFDYIDVEVEYQQVKGFVDYKLGWILLAFGISLVAVFLYALMVEKLSSAVATVSSMAAAFIIYLSIISLTRIPATSYVGIGAIISAILAGALSLVLASRYREEVKNTANAKLSVDEIAKKVTCSENKIFLWSLVFILVIAIAIGAFALTGAIYMGIIALQALIAGVIGTASAYFITPELWAAIKGSKKKN